VLGLIVHAGAERLAVPALAVVEVVPAVRLHPAAGAPPGVAGLAQYRGTVVPVVDLHRLATGDECPVRLSTRLVILDAPTGGGLKRLGLLVDRADELRDLPTFDARTGYAAPPADGQADLGPLLAVEGGVVRLPDLVALGRLAFGGSPVTPPMIGGPA